MLGEKKALAKGTKKRKIPNYGQKTTTLPQCHFAVLKVGTKHLCRDLTLLRRQLVEREVLKENGEQPKSSKYNTLPVLSLSPQVENQDKAFRYRDLKFEL